jgi:hypothetical protein
MVFRNPKVLMGQPYMPDEYRRLETTAQQVAAVVQALTEGTSGGTHRAAP